MTSKTITRSDLITALNEEVGLSQTDCAKLLEDVLNKITDTLAEGDVVKIGGFASFRPHQKTQRVGRNPKTREAVPIPPRKVIVFRPSEVLRDRVNGAGD